MRPDAESRRILGAIRATAKMHEFRVAPEDFIAFARAPETLLALAVGILGDAAAFISNRFTGIEGTAVQPSTWEEGDGSVADRVRFSAIYFDSYLEARINAELSAEFSLLCSASYYLSDAVGSAVVVARRSEAPSIELGHGLARLAYTILRNDYVPIEEASPHASFSTRLLSALNRHFSMDGASDEIASLCADLRTSVYENGSARELLYADITTALSARKLDNSARTILPPASNSPLGAWTPALRKPHFPRELWPAQRRICEADLLKGKSAIVQMPTSAGKTRATELIIRSLFLSGRSTLAVIVAPFRSLCHDIRADLVTAFAGEAIALDEVSDSFLFDIDLADVLAHKSVLVVTPEKMLYMLRRAPELAERIGLVIYDEGHQFEGFARGPTYELLLSSLRMTLAPGAQVVLISAVIGNAPQIAEWLVRDAKAIVSGEGLIPTTKSIAFASWQTLRGMLQYVAPTDPDQSEFFVPRIIASQALQLRERERTARVFPDRTANESTEVGLYLGLHLVENGSVALFCGTKDSVVSLARRAADIFSRGVTLQRPVTISDGAEIERLTRLAERNLGAADEASRASSLGILCHHSNTPHGLRLSVEHAMKEGKAKFVICTSTLAQGVNFPIRYLIVTATQQGRERIKVRDFHNLMGRAGRAGMHTEGSVIFSAPTIYDGRNGFGRWRWNAAKELLDPARAEPSLSSILDLFSNYKQDKPEVVLTLRTAWLNLAFATKADIDGMVKGIVGRYPKVNASEFREFVSGRARAVQSIAAYLAAYVDFDSDLAEDRIDELTRNTLAFHLADEETREKLLEVFRTTARAIEQSGDSDFRALIRKSPLPPAEVLALKTWTTANHVGLTTAAAEGRLLDALYNEARKYLTAKAFASLSNEDYVLPTLRGWIAGLPFHELALPLQNADVRMGRDKITSGHMVSLCEGAFGFDLAMVLASIVDLVEPLDAELSRQIAFVHRQVKNGLGNEPALAFYEAGFADRVVAQALGGVLSGATTRADVRDLCRHRFDVVRQVLDEFPTYFMAVALELRG